VVASKSWTILIGGAVATWTVVASVFFFADGVPSRAQEPEAQTLGVQLHTFADSRGVTVLSPTVDLGRDLTERTGLRVRFGVDAITAASDSCARCHAEGATNTREFVNASIIKTYGDTKVAVGGEFSHENFYQATTVSTSISRTLNQANTTVAAGYAFSWNRPQLHPDQTVENQAAHSAYATLTQTLSKYTVVQLGYELGSIFGYQSNPYLRTSVDGVRMVGVHPDERVRHALTAGLRQALPADTYLEADFRRYFDDWDVKANTWSVGLSHEFDPGVTFSGIYRRHVQQGASFYRPFYTGSPEFYTADFRLFPFSSNLYTGRLVITPKDGLMMFRPGTSLTAQYEFYKSTTKFEAGIFTLGVRLPLRHP
jgi:hypothetical protein